MKTPNTSAMTDRQLANLAAALVFIMLGPRALHALKAAVRLEERS